MGKAHFEVVVILGLEKNSQEETQGCFVDADIGIRIDNDNAY